MGVIKNILIDSLNGFSTKDIPLFLFQILMAALLAHLFQIIINKKLKINVIQHSALIASALAVLAAIVKYSLPFSVLALAIIIWLRPNQQESLISKIALLIVGLIGVGCGVGSVALTGLGAIVLFCIILFMPLKSDE